MKFQIGDIVELQVKPNYAFTFKAKNGAKAEVYDVGAEYIFVKWLDKGFGQADGGYMPESFIFVNSAKGEDPSEYYYELLAAMTNIEKAS